MSDANECPGCCGQCPSCGREIGGLNTRIAELEAANTAWAAKCGALEAASRSVRPSCTHKEVELHAYKVRLAELYAELAAALASERGIREALDGVLAAAAEERWGANVDRIAKLQAQVAAARGLLREILAARCYKGCHCKVIAARGVSQVRQEGAAANAAVVASTRENVTRAEGAVPPSPPGDSPAPAVCGRVVDLLEPPFALTCQREPHEGPCAPATPEEKL